MEEGTSRNLVGAIGSITGVLIVASLILSIWGRGGGPAWAQWLGLTFFGSLLLIPGILFLFDPQLSISWFRALKPRRRDGYTPEPLRWQRLQISERILIGLCVFSISGIGLYVMFYATPKLLRVWGVL
jgi:hypothetical protein